MARTRMALLALLLAACGSSRQQHALDAIGRVCTSQNGKRFQDADTAMRAQYPFDRIIPGCDPRLASLSRNNSCATSSADDPQCQVFYYWYTSDPGLCSPQGYCFYKCELRFMQKDPAAVASGTANDATVCAAAWHEGQPYP